MTRLLKVVPTTLLLVLAVTSPAYATFSEWLDKLGELSGPGPFIQRLGASVDVVCIEGQWWKDPASERVSVDTYLFDIQFRQALDKAVNSEDLAALTQTLRDLRRRAALRDAAPTSELETLYSKNMLRAQAILQQRIRANWWEIRERVFKAPVADRETVFREALHAHGLDRVAGDVDQQAVDDSFGLAVNPFCVGDMRKHRLNFGVYAAWFTTDKVPDSYHYGNNSTTSARVNAIPLTATIQSSLPFNENTQAKLLRSFDAGISIGRIFFAGERIGQVIHKWYVEPNVTVRPLSWKACRGNDCSSRWTTWDVLEVQGYMRHIGAFNAQEFGSDSDIHSDGDWHYWFRVGVTIKFNRDQTPPGFAEVK